MRFLDSPFVVFKHEDKKHLHYHVLVTNLDFEGERNKKLDTFYIKDSIRISRELEEKYGLTRVIESENRVLVSLAEKQAEERKYVKAYLGLEEESRVVFDELFGVGEGRGIREGWTDQDFFAQYGKDKASQIRQYLSQWGKVFESNKARLKRRVLEVRNISSNYSDFINRVNNQEDLYARMLTDKKRGKKYLKYGLKNDSLYVSEAKLSGELTLVELNAFFRNDMEKEKKYIRSMVTRSINRAKSFDEFKAICLTHSIEVIEHRNSGGVYGVSFKNLSLPEGGIYKASDISKKFTYGNLMKEFNLGTVEKTQGSLATEGCTPVNLGVHTLEHSDNQDWQTEEILARAKKKKKGKGR